MKKSKRADKWGDRRLQDLDGIGPAMFRDFGKSGITSVEQLAKQDGMMFFIKLNRPNANRP